MKSFVLGLLLLFVSSSAFAQARREELNPDGSTKNAEVHWYDKNVLLRTLSGTPSVEFEYDARGNWTRKTHLIKPADAEKPEAYWAEYREIAYY